MKHPFVQALIEMGIYDEYFKGLKNHRGQHSQSFFRKECNYMASGTRLASDTILGSFCFSDSSQGSLYWFKIHDEINEVYNSIKQETT